MIRTSPATYYRAAAAFAAAAVLSCYTPRASAQQSVDLFGGTVTSPATLSLTALVSGPTSTGGPVGPGYTGGLTLVAGAADTLNESFNSLSATTNSFTIAENGVATVAGTTSANKTFTGITLSPSSTYALTLTRTSGFTANLLGRLDISLADNVTLLSTSSGTGLAGAVDLLGLFGTSNTETLYFTVPAGATGNLTASITSSVTGGILGGSYTFQSATLTQVPEPRTTAVMLLGASGLVLLRFRRRLRSI